MSITMSITSIILLGFALVIMLCQIAQVIVSLREARRQERIDALRRAERSSTGLQIHVPGEGWVNADKYKV